MKLNSRQESQKTILGSSSLYISTHGQPSSLISVEPHTAQSYHVAQNERDILGIDLGLISELVFTA